MSNEGDILGFIRSKNGCLLTDIATEFQIPVCSVKSWVDIQCCTGYIRRCGHTHGTCACSKSGSHCVACTCMRRAVQAGIPVRIEVTEKGQALIGIEQDEKNMSDPKTMTGYPETSGTPGKEKGPALLSEIPRKITVSPSSEGRIWSKVSLEMAA